MTEKWGGGGRKRRRRGKEKQRDGGRDENKDILLIDSPSLLKRLLARERELCVSLCGQTMTLCLAKAVFKFPSPTKFPNSCLLVLVAAEGTEAGKEITILSGGGGAAEGARDVAD